MARQCVVIHPCLSKELRVVEYMLDDASCLLGNPVVSLPPTMTSLKYIYQAQFECPTQISWLINSDWNQNLTPEWEPGSGSKYNRKNASRWTETWSCHLSAYYRPTRPRILKLQHQCSAQVHNNSGTARQKLISGPNLDFVCSNMRERLIISCC